MVLLILAGLAGQVSARLLGHDYLLGAVPEFDLNEENNVPTWFSTICLFLCALALALISLLEWRKHTPLSLYWVALAGTFVLLSLDEAASFHEMLVVPLRRVLHTSGFFYYAWVIPGIVFVFGYLLVMWRFLREIPARTRRDFLVAGFVYCAGALGMEMVDGRHASLYGADLTYGLMTVVEESLEMIGEILLLRALLAYLAEHAGMLTIRLRAAPAPVEKGHAAA